MGARLLRRIIKRSLHAGGFGSEVAHARSFVVSARALKEVLEPELVAPLDVEPLAADDAHALLLARPTDEELHGVARGAALAATWRELFHARVHLELERAAATGELSHAAVLDRVHRVGQAEFDEIRLVLREGEHLLPEGVLDRDRQTWIEFVALYTELACFDRPALARTFPSLVEVLDEVDATIALDLDVPALLEATRLDGASSPALNRDAEVVSDDPDETKSTFADSAPTYSSLMKEVESAADEGNVVRAAVGLARALAQAPDRLKSGLVDRINQALTSLVRRLFAALDDQHEHQKLDGPARDPVVWVAHFFELLRAAASRSRVVRGVEARLLYDVLKAAIAHERENRTIDLLAWITSLGGRPIVRALPATRPVRVLRYLRSAQKKAARARIGAESRRRLSALLEAAIEQAEFNVRRAHKPAVADAIDAMGLASGGAPLAAARAKLIDELLDRCAGAGHFSIGELRDAVSRSRLKLADVSAKKLLAGDELLVADRALADSLDGVYRRGEIYLRGLQKASSLAFGTRPGRALVLYVVVPTLGAFVLLEGLTHLVHLIAGRFTHHPIHLLSWPSFAGVSVALFALIHSRRVRDKTLAVLRTVRGALRAVFLGAPRWLASTAMVRAIVASQPFQVLWSFLLKPLVVAGAFTAIAAAPGVRGPALGVIAGASLVVSSLALNSKAGREASTALVDWLLSKGRALRRHVIPGLFKLIAEKFAALVATIEWVLYRVDQALRFRQGEHPLSSGAKAVLGVGWAFVTFLVRFYVNLLIEPQVNPIKHFPVVTVSHKIILPMTPSLLGVARQVLMPLGPVLANTIAAPTVFLLPGVFGFLVWELKENFKLYEANRATELKPVMIGHHGETMTGLLVAGFHSGTIPKQFAALRRAERQSLASSGRLEARALRKPRAALAEVAHALEHFVERELVLVLRASSDWTSGPMHVGHPHMTSNRVRIELTCPEVSTRPCVLEFAEQSRWVVASVHEPGFTEHMSSKQRAVFERGLVGLYKAAGVDLVREQVAAVLASAFGSAETPYDLAETGLVVWPSGDYRRALVYDVFAPNTQPLTAESKIAPRPPENGELTDGERPALPLVELVFRFQRVAWVDWVRAWGGDASRALVPGSILGPRRRGQTSTSDRPAKRALVREGHARSN
ncbi:MAG: hypothetical protein U0271_06925 [Polyangiaceae bacterium]